MSYAKRTVGDCLATVIGHHMSGVLLIPAVLGAWAFRRWRLRRAAACLVAIATVGLSASRVDGAVLSGTINYTGSLTGPVYLSAESLAPLSNRVLALDGSGDWVSHTTRGIDSRVGTVEGWVRPSSVTSWGFWQTHDSSGINFSDWIAFFSWADTNFYFRMGSGSSDLTFGNSTWITTEQWTHLAFTWTGTTMISYVNGTQVASRANATFQSNMDPGARIGQGHDVFLNGLLDELRIWNRALSSDEIVLARQRRMTGSEANLVAYFTFDEASATDSCTRTNHGAFAGNATTVFTNLPFLLTNAFQFAGTGAYSLRTLPTNQSYNLSAFLDANTNGVWDAGEPQGSFAGNPLAFTGDVSGISLTLTGPVERTSSANLLAFYRFETNLLDAVSNRYPLTGQGGPGYQAGTLGRALVLTSAASQYVQNVTFTSAHDVRTIDCWVNLASITGSTRYAWTLSDGDTENQLAVYAVNSNLLYRLTIAASQVWLIQATNLAAGNWHHVVATCGSNGAALYVNGQLFGTDSSTATPLSSMSQLRIGSKPNTPQSFDGQIDNVALFSTPHSSNVVQYSYNLGKGIDFLAEKINGTVAYAGLQTGTIYVLADAGAAGTWTNALSTTGAYEFAQLVPYTNYTLTSWRDYTANGVKDPWEAQGAYVGNPVGLFVSNIPNASITITDPVFTVSGQVTYSGGQTGPVHATISTDTGGLQVLSRAIVPIQPGTFTITNVPGGGPFYVRAFMDSNGNASNESWEANNSWVSNPVVVTSSISGVAIDMWDLDSDTDGMPDWWEVKYGLNPTNEPFFGDGSDGVLVVPAGTTQFVDAVKTAVTGVNNTGTNRLNVASTNGFLVNDTVLVIAMQDPNSDMNQNIAGLYEFRRINGTTNGALLLKEPLATNYSVTSSQKIQAIRVPEYSSLTVSGLLTCATWDGASGGVLALYATSAFIASNSSISASGKGFRGGPDYQAANVDGYQGESFAGPYLSRTFGANYGGGSGGGRSYQIAGSGAGGGGYGTSGMIGTYPSDNSPSYCSPNGCTDAAGGGAYGNASLNRLYLGSGGGSGGQDGDNPDDGNFNGGWGGNGGGIVALRTYSLSVQGQLRCNGMDAATNTLAERGNGGAGSGGSILIQASYISASSLLTATGGLGGRMINGGLGGDGGSGRIRIDLANSNDLPLTYPSVGWTGMVTSAMGDAGIDSDNDGLTNLQEYEGDSNPNVADTDGDGIPDLWEVTYNTNPTNANAFADTDSDGLNNLLEYQLGSRPNTNDTDGDLLLDFDEYQIHGTSPNSVDTDGDGMPDAWEVQYGLNPTINDANEDRDHDWVSNLQEYQNSFNPRAPDSGLTGTNDYRRVNTGLSGARYIYDRIDRLTGAEYEKGLSIAYVYDGNGNITRQKYFDRDEDDDGLLDLKEFLAGLNHTNAANGQGFADDADGDGWSNYQELQAGTSPTNAASYPDVLGRSGTNVAVVQAGFTPDLFNAAVGQLLIGGAEELVIGADGNTGGAINVLTVLSQNYSGWSSQSVTVGPFGVTSLLIGQPTNQSVPAIYAGLRAQAPDHGQIRAYWRSSAGWLSSVVAYSTGQYAYVHAMTPQGTILASIPSLLSGPDAIIELQFTNGQWVSSVYETNSASPQGVVMARYGTADTLFGLLRQRSSDGLIILDANAYSNDVIDNFEDSIVDPTRWVTNGGRTTYAGYSVQESIGQMRCDASWQNASGVNSANAWAELTNLWAGETYAVRIDIADAYRNGNGDGFVRLGGSTIYSAASHGNGYGLLDIVNLASNCYYRRKVGAGSWSDWAAVGYSDVLRIQASGSESGSGDAHIYLNSIDKYAPGHLARSGGASPNDFSDANAAYRASNAVWYFRSSSSQSWSEVAASSFAMGASIADAVTSNLNQWIAQKFGSGLWLGAHRPFCEAPWIWASGSPWTFTNWSLGGEACLSSNLVAVYGTNGEWTAVSPDTSNRAVLEASKLSMMRPPLAVASSTVSKLLSASRSTDWTPIGSSSSMVASLSISDIDASGSVSFGDIVTLELDSLTASNAMLFAITSRIVSAVSPIQNYALTFAEYTNGSTPVLFSAWPDGHLYASSPRTNISLDVFSAHYLGSSWHQLRAMRTLEPGQALVGLRVATQDVQTCHVHIWLPQPSLGTVASIPQTAPSTRILPSPNFGVGIAQVDVKIWDAEGNRAFPELQYQLQGSTNWIAASVSTVNGMAYGMALAVDAHPTGRVHVLRWDSVADLGMGFTNTLRLRSRSRDQTMTGAWSEAVPYQIMNLETYDGDGDGLPDIWENRYGLDVAQTGGVHGANGDWDGDGRLNWEEYLADTNPTNAQSQLLITRMRYGSGGTMVDWIGGTAVVQYVEFGELSGSNTIWRPVFTNVPPTEVQEGIIDVGRTNNAGWYRIKTQRP